MAATKTNSKYTIATDIGSDDFCDHVDSIDGIIDGIVDGILELAMKDGIYCFRGEREMFFLRRTLLWRGGGGANVWDHPSKRVEAVAKKADKKTTKLVSYQKTNGLKMFFFLKKDKLWKKKKQNLEKN